MYFSEENSPQRGGAATVNRQANGTLQFSGGNVGGVPQHLGAGAAVPSALSTEISTAGTSFGARRQQAAPMSPTGVSTTAAPTLGARGNFRSGNTFTDGTGSQDTLFFSVNTAQPVPTTGFGARRPAIAAQQPRQPEASESAPGLGADARHLISDFDRTPVATPAGRNLSYDFDTTAPSAAGAGRGAVNPPRASQGPGFTQELGAVPRELPTGMQSGAIYRTTGPDGRVTYSGRDVSGDAPMVDGLGNQVAQRGSVNVIGGGGTGSGAYADRQLSLGRAAAMQRGDFEAVRASYGEGQTRPTAMVVGAEGAFGIRRAPSIASDARLGARRVQQAFRQDSESQREAAALVERRADRELQRAQVQQNANFEMARLGVQREGNYLQAQGRAGGGVPAGYRFKGDGTLEAIPGGPADIKAGELGAKRENQQRGAVDQANRVIGMAEKAGSQVSGLSAGFVGHLAKGLPGTAARDLSSNLETIKANLGFAELQAMREASPTGGALGAIAVQELVALQSTVASLDQAQSPDQLRKNLQKIGQHYQKWKYTVERANGLGASGASPSAPTGQQAAPVAVTTQAQWASLPAGTLYTAPDGSTRRKQ